MSFHVAFLTTRHHDRAALVQRAATIAAHATRRGRQRPAETRPARRRAGGARSRRPN